MRHAALLQPWRQSASGPMGSDWGERHAWRCGILVGFPPSSHQCRPRRRAPLSVSYCSRVQDDDWEADDFDAKLKLPDKEKEEWSDEEGHEAT